MNTSVSNQMSAAIKADVNSVSNCQKSLTFRVTYYSKEENMIWMIRRGKVLFIFFLFCYMLSHTLLVIRHVPDKDVNLEKTIEQLRFINR